MRRDSHLGFVLAAGSRGLVGVFGATIALLALASVASAAPADRKFVTLRGRVADPSGAPLADVRVEAAGTREAIALTSPEGRFTLTLELGALNQIQLHPVAVAVRARREGYRVLVAGGAPELAMELRLGVENGQPVMQSRSNYGIIADALLEALAPAGERTATLQVSFVAARGAPRDSSALVPADFRSVPIAEPWLARPTAATTPKVRAEKEPVARREEAARREEPAPAPPRVEPPPVASPKRAESPPATTSAARGGDSERPASQPKRRKAPKPEKPKRAPGESAAHASRTTATRAENRAQAERPSTFVPPRPSPVRSGRADSLTLLHQAEQRAAIAGAQAERDSLFRIQRTQSLARKSVVDSMRAIREAAEDSARRARLHLPPRPASRPTESASAVKPRPEKRSEDRKQASKQREKPSEAEREAGPAEATRAPEPGFAPSVSSPTAPTGLRRVGVRDEAAPPRVSDAEDRAALEADTCTCRVKGTIETEFHRLLTSPLKVEVSIRELPALRDTVDLFMGSPRAFEMERVPCGTWSLALRPFSDRPFGVTTPEEVAPFDCRQRSMRQVRIVIAPVKASH